MSHKIPIETLIQIKKGLDNGLSAADISAKLNVSYGTVLRKKKETATMSHTEKRALQALRVISEKVQDQSNQDELWVVPYGRRRTLLEDQLLTALKDIHDVVDRFSISFERVTLVSDPDGAA